MLKINVEVQGAWGELWEAKRLRKWGGFNNESAKSLRIRILSMRNSCGLGG